MPISFILKIENLLRINNQKSTGMPDDIVNMVIMNVFHDGKCDSNDVNALINKHGYKNLPKMSASIYVQTLIVYILKINDKFNDKSKK